MPSLSTYDKNWQKSLTLRNIDFDGYLAMECAVRGDAKTALPEVVRYLRSLMG